MDAVASYVGRALVRRAPVGHEQDVLQSGTLPLAAQALVDLMLAGLGRVVKCVIFDLDNTLWGGVVGDVGALGIEIGAHGDGEPTTGFSNTPALKGAAFCSPSAARTSRKRARRLRQNPAWSSSPTSRCSWRTGTTRRTTSAIRDTLEIGYDSLVSLDDNPFERNLVRKFLPEVIVPELPDDPADYVRAVSELNLFETTAFSAEDAARSDLYSQEADRRVARALHRHHGISAVARHADLRGAVPEPKISASRSCSCEAINST